MAELEVSTPDGRVARRLENRTRILDALFALIRSGKPHPTLKEIAARAGVTPRTLLNHFPDVGSLMSAAVARSRELAARKLPEVDQRLPPAARVTTFFRESAGFYDAYAAIRWATLTSPVALPGFDARQSRGVVLGMLESRVGQLCEGLGANLDRDRQLRQALRVLIDPLAWRLLRTQQRLSRAEAAASMARGVLAFARDASRGRG